MKREKYSPVRSQKPSAEHKVDGATIWLFQKKKKKWVCLFAYISTDTEEYKRN